MIYTVDDITKRWKCGPKVVRAVIKSGELPAFKVGYYWRVREEDLLKYESKPKNTMYLRR